MPRNKGSWRWLKWCVSPTLWVSDTFKKGAPTIAKRGERVKTLNKIYLSISVVLLVGLWICGWFVPITKFWPMALFWLLYCISRCNEIFFAFIKDAFDKLDPHKREANGLAYYERVQMALRSYLELIINYAILFYVLDGYSRQYYHALGLFNQSFENLFTALYFSVITIVAVGYGDIYPTQAISRALVCYEVMTGILLLVVSFTIYVSISLSE
ncbi:MAG: potassium channel family protein [Cellulosilyticaceae bacterium]